MVTAIDADGTATYLYYITRDWNRHSHRVLWFKKGMRLAHFTPEFVVVVLIGEPTGTMTHDNCCEFVLHNNHVIHSRQLGRQVGESMSLTGKEVNS